MKEIFGVFAAGALMVVCCLLPLVLIGAGSAGIAGILAWFGGLNPILILAAVGGGGILAYHVVRRAKGSLDRREGSSDGTSHAAPTREGWSRIPDSRSDAASGQLHRSSHSK
ncbi:MAG: hypothetical protein V3V86_12815 [Gammaproteobacteria bacterium]